MRADFSTFPQRRSIAFSYLAVYFGRMLSKTFLAAVLALACTSFSASAALEWEKPIQELQRTPDDKFAVAHYAFKNSGTAPVTIKAVRTSCGCTTASLDKKTYQPGEGGEIVVTYSFHGQTGQLRKLVTVITDDQPQPTVLDLRVMVAEPLTIRPTFVYWRVGDPPEPKTVALTGNANVKVKNVVSSNPRLIASLETVKPGQDYVVTVKPLDTTTKEAGEITVATDFPAEAPRNYTIHVRIK